MRTNRYADGVREVARSGEASEVDVRQSQSRQSTVCVWNKFEAITEQGHGKKTKQWRKKVRFDCDSDEPTSCEEERGERPDGSETWSVDTEECRNGQNFVGTRK